MRDRRWLALVLLCAIQFMVVLDVSIVNVALPTIKTALHFSPPNLQWVVSAYTLTFGGFLLLGGRTADLLGRRRLFMGGLVLFSLASLACGLSGDTAQLIAFRAIQGLGAAIISPAALSLLTTTFAEGAERNKALGIWGAIAGMGGAVGVLLGGILVTASSWEWIFFINVPVGALVFAAAPRLLEESRVETATRSFDLLGAVAVHRRPRRCSSTGWSRPTTPAGRRALVGAARRRRRAAGRVRRDRAARRRRCSRSRSSGCGRSPAPTSSASCSARRSSRCSSCSRSTCSRCWATRPCEPESATS